MALQDSQMVLALALALTSDAASTNCYDTGPLTGGSGTNAGRDIADGAGALSIFIHPTVSADHTTTDETYTFNLRTSATQASDALTNTINTLLSTVVSYADLTTGKVVEIVIPKGLAFLQYIDVYYDGGGTTPTLTADIWLAPRGSCPTSLKSYARGYDASN